MKKNKANNKSKHLSILTNLNKNKPLLPKKTM